MDPQDEQEPLPRRLPYVVLQENAERLRHRLSRQLADLPERLRRIDDGRTTPFVPESETVMLDVRRHPFLLLWPALRTVFGLVLLGTGLALMPLLTFALTVVVWAQVRHGWPLRKDLLVTAAAAAAAVVLPAPLFVLLLLAWAAEDVADWWCDRLVVTDRRIYRRYGVITSHAPSIALTAIAFIDAAVPPLGRLLGYGTLRLDSVAQRDAPLARLDLVPDVIAVSHEILRLRSSAMPKFPPLPH